MHPAPLTDFDHPGDRFHLPGAPHVVFEVADLARDGDLLVKLRAGLHFPDGTADTVERQLLLPAATHVVPVQRPRVLAVPCLSCKESSALEFDTVQPSWPRLVLCQDCDERITAGAQQAMAAYSRPFWITRDKDINAHHLDDTLPAALATLAAVTAKEPGTRWELWSLSSSPRRWALLATAAGGALATTPAGRRRLAMA